MNKEMSQTEVPYHAVKTGILWSSNIWILDAFIIFCPGVVKGYQYLLGTAKVLLQRAALN